MKLIIKINEKMTLEIDPEDSCEVMGASTVISDITNITEEKEKFHIDYSEEEKIADVLSEISELMSERESYGE